MILAEGRKREEDDDEKMRIMMMMAIACCRDRDARCRNAMKRKGRRG